MHAFLDSAALVCAACCSVVAPVEVDIHLVAAGQPEFHAAGAKLCGLSAPAMLISESLLRVAPLVNSSLSSPVRKKSNSPWLSTPLWNQQQQYRDIIRIPLVLPMLSKADNMADAPGICMKKMSRLCVKNAQTDGRTRPVAQAQTQTSNRSNRGTRD